MKLALVFICEFSFITFVRNDFRAFNLRAGLSAGLNIALSHAMMLSLILDYVTKHMPWSPRPASRIISEGNENKRYHRSEGSMCLF